jgi:hypothetical protein
MFKAATKERLNKAQKGQSLVEMAISMVLLTMMVSGVIDLGRLWFSYVALEDAAGEAALFLSIFPYCAEADDDDPYQPDANDCEDPDNAVFRAQNAMGNNFIGFSWDQVTFEPDTSVCPNHYLDFQGCDPYTNTPIIEVPERFTVRLDYKFHLISPFIPQLTEGATYINLTAVASQQIIRENTSG